MARIFDVIEYANEMSEEIVHRFPDDTSIGDYRIGSNVIVRDGQTAVFFRDGQALDMFGPGIGCGFAGDSLFCHTLRLPPAHHLFHPDRAVTDQNTGLPISLPGADYCLVCVLRFLFLPAIRGGAPGPDRYRCTYPHD